MSSERKDARWELAMKMAAAGGIEWNDMSWGDVTALLQIAENQLSRDPGRIPVLAQEWNEHDGR